ncbi:MAG: hypothetical protein JJD92_03920 [Frankiaceae bacterium]|nr:hypothetical protein [Frankiaceae bacterium]
MWRRLLTARWLVGLALTLVGAAGMIGLGYWQLGRGEANNSIQNYSYAVEWLLFAAFTVFCFVKLLRDDGVDAEDEPVPPSVVLPPPPATTEPEDDELAAYNAYLARLNAQSS